MKKKNKIRKETRLSRLEARVGCKLPKTGLGPAKHKQSLLGRELTSLPHTRAPKVSPASPALLLAQLSQAEIWTNVQICCPATPTLID